MHVVAAGAADRQRRDAVRERGVGVGRAVAEHVGQAHLGAGLADGGQQGVLAVEAAGGPAPERLDRQLERCRQLQVGQRGGELVQRPLVQRARLDGGLRLGGDGVDRRRRR